MERTLHGKCVLVLTDMGMNVISELQDLVIKAKGAKTMDCHTQCLEEAGLKHVVAYTEDYGKTGCVKVTATRKQNAKAKESPVVDPYSERA